jgi:NADH:ubiquinone oxidoreductase subunit D
MMIAKLSRIANHLLWWPATRLIFDKISLVLYWMDALSIILYTGKIISGGM